MKRKGSLCQMTEKEVRQGKKSYISSTAGTCVLERENIKPNWVEQKQNEQEQRVKEHSHQQCEQITQLRQITQLKALQDQRVSEDADKYKRKTSRTVVSEYPVKEHKNMYIRITRRNQQNMVSQQPVGKDKLLKQFKEIDDGSYQLERQYGAQQSVGCAQEFPDKYNRIAQLSDSQEYQNNFGDYHLINQNTNLSNNNLVIHDPLPQLSVQFYNLLDNQSQPSIIADSFVFQQQILQFINPNSVNSSLQLNLYYYCQTTICQTQFMPFQQFYQYGPYNQNQHDNIQLTTFQSFQNFLNNASYQANNLNLNIDRTNRIFQLFQQNNNNIIENQVNLEPDDWFQINSQQSNDSMRQWKSQGQVECIKKMNQKSIFSDNT